MKVISLFSGCGGLDLGFEQAGFEVPVANEFDSTIYETFKVNHPNTHLVEGDIRKVTHHIFLAMLMGLLGDPHVNRGQKLVHFEELMMIEDSYFLIIFVF